MKKSKIITLIIVFGVIICSSLTMTMLTNHLANKKVFEKNIDFTNELLNYEKIQEAIYFGADKVDQNEEGLIYYFENKDGISDTIKEEAKSVVNNWEDNFRQEKDFEYYVHSNATNKSVSNTNEAIQTLFSDKQLQKKYRWYIRISFDANGEITILTNEKNSKDALQIQEDIIDKLERFQSAGLQYVYDEIDEKTGAYLSTQTYNTSFNPITNTEYVFALKEGKGEAIGFIDEYEGYSIRNNVLGIMAPACFFMSLCIFLIALFIPFRYLKDIALFKQLARIKIDILVVASFLFGLGLISTILEITSTIANYGFDYLTKMYEIEFMTDEITNVVIFIPWLLFFTIIFFAGYMLKLLFDKGLTRFIKENTLIGWFIKKIMRLFDRASSFDLQDPSTRAVLKIVGLNFLIVSVISFFFVFGFTIAFLYSIVLFVVIRNKFDEIKRDYDVLFKATKKLSQGDFDIDIKEDLGMFNSLRDEFTHIRDGFETAVNEEVKSQKMKTELVSNVSHDLKTPLTSIITYTDLLKDETISEQQRREYTATLERNALRLKNIIDDLFEMSKVNSGNVALNIVDVDIVSLIKQAQFECLDMLEKKHLHFNMNFSQDKIVHKLDSSKTYRVFENLFTNIGKYALENTRVYIDVTNDDESVSIVFKNISETALNVEGNDLVERFVQGDQSRNSEGSGLGLAIAKSFVELQNGTFDVVVDGDLFKVSVQFKK